ncbi:MAG: hypothetical protein INR64_14305 [Caulobacteraceae bacterium]|nr:hypothetical protein [Caulobacter sp.]
MSLDSLFLRHPREQGESYTQHARFAFGVGARMMLGGLACMVHGAAPALFETTGSRTLRHLNHRLANRHAEAIDASGPAVSAHTGSLRT